MMSFMEHFGDAIRYDEPAVSAHLAVMTEEAYSDLSRTVSKRTNIGMDAAISTVDTVFGHIELTNSAESERNLVQAQAAQLEVAAAVISMPTVGPIIGSVLMQVAAVLIIIQDLAAHDRETAAAIAEKDASAKYPRDFKQEARVRPHHRISP